MPPVKGPDHDEKKEDEMARQKRFRYKDVQEIDTIFMPRLLGVEPIRLSPEWPVDTFGNDAPVTLELGCGKGEYSVALAARYPDRNFVGVDVKADRLWVGATMARDAGLTNVRFIRARVDHLPYYLPENFADSAWIPFPDPKPGNLSGRKRLTSPRFIAYYRRFMTPGARIRFKTDHDGLYAFTMENLGETGAALSVATEDLHGSGITDPDIIGIESHFEKEFLKKGDTVKFMEFTL